MALDNAEAFTAVYNRYWKFLYCLACKKLENAAEAEELVQDIFLDLWQRRTSLQVYTSLSSYLSVTVNYKVLKVLARRHLYAKYKDSVAGNNISIEMEPLLEFEEVQEKLLALVKQLPAKCGLVFRMSREQAMTGREIAEQLCISEKTVESHITKALHHLKTGLGSLLLLLLLLPGK